MSSRIIIAEDDESMRTVLTDALTRKGFRVDPVHDGQLLWTMLDDGPADLIVLDLRMPGMNGWEVLRKLKGAHANGGTNEYDVPVIVVSAQSDPETRRFALRLGAAAFMAKPIDIIEFGATVRKVLRAHGN
jgi:DNA-binding response OmpR family regulator